MEGWVMVFKNENSKLQKIVEDDWEWRCKFSPEFASMLGQHSEEVLSRLDDRSIGAYLTRASHCEGVLRSLKGIDVSQLSAAKKLTFDLFQDQMHSIVDGQKYRTYLLAVSSLEGPQHDLFSLVEAAPFETQDHFEWCIQRFLSFPRQIQEIIELLTQGVVCGMVLPRVAMSSVPEQINGICDTEACQSALFVPFLNMPNSWEKVIKESFKKRALDAIQDFIYPAFRALLTFLQEQYIPQTRSTVGCKDFPHGEELYAQLLKFHTSTKLTPQEIHELGLKEVDKIQSEMTLVMKKCGHSGSLQDFLQYLRSDPRFYWTSDEDLVEGYRSLCKRIDPELIKVFKTLPRLPYGVFPFSPIRAPSAPQGYYEDGSIAGSRPGIFRVNTYKLESRPKYEMECLALHESVPGHHLQTSIAQELDLPSFRRHVEDRRYQEAPGRYPLYTSYLEGWGLYSESLGKEIGLYEDPYSEFGALAFQMWRACRLVVDSGLHHLNWSRAQGIAFLEKRTALSTHAIETEVDRYVTWPGQACAYYVGFLKLRELRSWTEGKLQSSFDVRSFHDCILGEGPLPLEILEQVVKSFVESVRMATDSQRA